MTSNERVFIASVKDFYTEKGRHDLPWRQTTDPYCILVSEIMLQQTQVDRVVLKYVAFLRAWPSSVALSRASLADVLRAWQGLGYNRRAKMLHECAKEINNSRKGTFPDSYADLLTLPGVGPYTAAAVSAFAFNKAIPLIETNVRTVYFNHFFPKVEKVSDAELLELVKRTLDHNNPREWYYALMDYGTHLKKLGKGSLVKSKHHKKQGVFKGSDREIRGAVLRVLGEQACTKKSLHAALMSFDTTRINEQVIALEKEGLVMVKNRRFQLPT